MSQQGFQLLGPTIREDAIVYDFFDSIEDLPIGWAEEKKNGTYRLIKRDDSALFGYTVGQHSWKKIMRPLPNNLWHAERHDKKFRIITENPETPKIALIGVRSCDLHAIALQDHIFIESGPIDPLYKSRRESLFIVAINCGQSGGTCFCASMNTGPKANSGFDIALTEIVHPTSHRFIVEVGTRAGEEVMKTVRHSKATVEDIKIAKQIVERAANEMGRSIDITDIKDLFYRNYEHSRWKSVANRCLSCGNCTLVCPTCYCTTIEGETDLKGERATVIQRSDSCFTNDFSYIHGTNIRSSPSSRYRQWIYHKLATGIDQFGTSCCVGCGRCITWCPAGIDITEEADAIRIN